LVFGDEEIVEDITLARIGAIGGNQLFDRPGIIFFLQQDVAEARVDVGIVGGGGF